MALPVIYFRGGEDVDFNVVGGGASVGGSKFRANYARASLATASATNTNYVGGAWEKQQAHTALSTYWATVRVSVNVSSNTNDFVRFYDSGGVARLILRSIVGSTDTFGVFKKTAGGVETQLGSNFTMGLANAPASPDKLDFFINYGTSGQFSIYVNGSSSAIFNFSGNIATDSATALTGIGLGAKLNSNATPLCFWSEIIVSDSDTRTMSLVTIAPVANGNTHNFDTGTPAASNVNETTINDTTLDGSSVAGQIDQYTIGGLPAGTWTILDVAVVARAEKGASGPTKMDLGVRSNSIDTWSADQALTASFATYAINWGQDPGTSAPWLALPVNIGAKSVA